MRNRLAVFALCLAALSCNSSNPTEPEAVPTPAIAPTPVPAPAAPQAFSCPLTKMADHGRCRADSPNFDGHVLQAVQNLIAQQPHLFDVNDQAGCPTCVRLVNGPAFERAMVAELGKMGLCAQCDEECGVKSTNDWNDQFKLANSTGYLLRPDKFYKVTCYPAAF